ncbi:UNVERIFIED_CONTAM: hypothetical protein FKN15_004695 [Acipenser sinensis]
MAGSQSVDIITKVLENQMIQTAKALEEQLDAEMTKLDTMDEDELDRLKERRLEALKKAQQQKQSILALAQKVKLLKDSCGFSGCRGKEIWHVNIADVFPYERCKILDKHLAILAKKHLETKFIKLNVEKAPFLTERLHIKVIPTLALVKDGKTKDYVVGFNDLGNTDEFTTEVLEWRLGCSEMINYRCKILDKHLAILAKKHLETKFIKLNVEKAPFLTERLHIKVIPTLALVKDGKTKDYVVGFNDLGNTDEFTTEVLEWRLGCSEMINYSGNLMEPPTAGQKQGSKFTKVEKKTIRGRGYDSDSDDDD